jgi:hypothetical protein
MLSRKASHAAVVASTALVRITRAFTGKTPLLL